MGEIAKSVQETDKIWYEISVLAIWDKMSESWKSTIQKSITRSFFAENADANKWT
jgi:hypothetical protein